MANIGFLKDYGTSKRIRIALPGNDANDMSIPPNAVVLDSEMGYGVLGVYEQGTVSFSLPVDGKVASWADPGYVPLLHMFIASRAIYKGTDADAIPPSINSVYFGPGWPCTYKIHRTTSSPRILAKRDGIYVRHGYLDPKDGFRGWAWMQYTAYRLPVRA